MKKCLLKRQVLVLLFSLITLNLFPQTFVEQTGISLPGVSRGSVAWGDYDDDGDLDILLTGFSYTFSISKIYRNNGNNSFTEQTGISLTGVESSSVGWGDYDNDGDLDILLTGSIISKIYHNNVDNSFTEQTGSALTGVEYSSVAWGDYDNDGDLDILLTGYSGSDFISKIYRNNGDNTFTGQTDIALEGLLGGSVAWGDYDNDGDLDILLTGQNNFGQIFSKIYRNNGDNSFTEQTGIALTGVSGGSVAWGDYDNDGDLDILLTGNTDSGVISKIYRNNSDNTFTEQTDIALTEVTRSSVTWGDYDNDGDLDILLTGKNSSGLTVSKIYRNNSDNTFTEQTGIALTGVHDSSVAWGDYDNDGDLDFLLTGANRYDQRISKIYRNEILNQNIKPSDPTGLQSYWDNDCIIFKWNKSSDNTTPTAAISYNLRIGTSPGGNEVKSAQALPNGKLLLTNIPNLINDTCITLKLPLNKYYWSVQAVDKGGLASSFAPEEITPLDSIQAKDLQAFIKTNNSMLIRWKNGNGLRRALFGRLSSPSEPAKPVNGIIYHAEPYFGKGDKIGTTDWYCMYNGKADSAIIYGLGEGYSYDIQVIEYTEINGLPEYFNTIGNGNPGVFSSSLFSEQTGIELSVVTWSSVAWGDYDNDGYLDVLLTGYTGFVISKIYRNNGDNSFTGQTGISLVGVGNGSAAWGDYDNDGDLDILITGATVNYPAISTSVIKIYRNDGANIFTEQPLISLAAVYYSSVAWGDYDNDGDLDILLTGATGDSPNYNPISKIYRNNGHNSFTEQTDIALTGVYNSSVAWGDYDNDGDLDILLTGQYSSDQNQAISKIYCNNGDNSFTEQTDIALTGVWYGSAAWGDYDNDGDLDIILTGDTGDYPNYNPISKIYRNNGDNSFTEQTSIALTGVFYSSVAWGDYDNDGYLDIILTGRNSSYLSISKIYRNNSNNSFTERTGIALMGVCLGSVDWGDYDNDGDLDILLTGGNVSFSPISKIYRNNTFMKAGNYSANEKPTAPVKLSATQQPGGTKITWAPVKTDETPYKTMTYNIRVGIAPEVSGILSAQSDSVNGYRRIVAMGNAQLDTTFIIKNLLSGKYYWNVQAVDQGYKGGEWSAVDSFIVKNTQAFFKTDTVCQGLVTHFTDQSVATDGIASWKWDFKDGISSSVQSPIHTYSANGTYLVKLVITSTAGDKDSLEQNVIVKLRPIASFTAPNVCEGTTTTITNNTNVNGLTIGNWFWNFGDGQTSSVQSPVSHTYSLKGSYQTKLKATATNGCADSITKEVVVAAIPNAAVSVNGKTTFCQGDSVQLNVEYNPLYNYQWKLDNNDLTNTDTSSYKVKLNSGAYLVKVTNTLANCIATSSQTNVTVNSIPVSPYISASRPVQFCQGDSTILSVSNTAGYSYQWRQNGGAIGSDQNSFTAKYSGDYTVTVSNSSGCSANSMNTVNVVVNPKPTIPTVGVNGAKSFCKGGSVDLSVTYNPTYAYQWQDSGSDISNATSNTHTAKNSGVYSLNILNSDGCSVKTENVTINVLASPDGPSISASGPTQFCQGDSVELSVTNTSGFTYQWKLNGGAVGTNSNQFVARSSGTYNLVVSNSNGCSAASTNSIDVTVNPAPGVSNISLSGPSTFCQGGNVTLSVPYTSGYSYNWRNEDGVISGANTNAYTASSSGKYQLEIANLSGCAVKTSPVIVLVNPFPYKPVISTDNYQPGLCPGESQVKLYVSQEVTGYKYQWFRNGIPSPNGTLPYLEGFLLQGDYSVEADLNGCKSESDIRNVSFGNTPDKPKLYVRGPVVWYMAASTNSAKEYRWYRNNELIQGATKFIYVANKTPGTYKVAVSNENDCFTMSDEITIPVTKSEMTDFHIPKEYLIDEDIDPFENLRIYPNPATGLFTIEMDNEIFGELLISIITEQGKDILSIKFEKTTEHFLSQVDLSGQSKGIYIINFLIDKYSAIRKVIVE
jgi:PKD repeat protein/predicted nucleotidyltransferase